MDREVPSPSVAVRGWDEQLRARGYRVTPQRQLVLEAVARLDHATPEEIGAQVQQTARGVNISTIYRTLELLEQIGMVTHTHLGHGAPIYHLASRCRPRAPGLPGLRPGHRDRPGRDPPADHHAGGTPRIRDRRGPSHRLRPLRRLPDGRRCLILRHGTSELLRILPGAVQAGWPDEGVAAHYGDPLREQRATEASAGVVDRSNRGVVRITGPDRLSWLHSLTTQALDGLAPGASAQALVLSPNGHVEHHLTLTDDGTATWLHVEPGTAAALVEFLESMRFMLRVEVADVSGDHAVLTVLGPAAGDIAAGLDGVRASVKPGPFGTIDLIVARDRLADAAGDLVRRGAAAAGMWAFEALGSPRTSPGSAWTPTTGPSRTRSAGSRPPCTWTRAATAARRRSRECTTSATRRGGWSS